MNFEFIGNWLNTVHQLQRSEYRLIDISLQIKAKFTTFKSISARRNLKAKTTDMKHYLNLIQTLYAVNYHYGIAPIEKRRTGKCK